MTDTPSELSSSPSPSPTAATTTFTHREAKRVVLGLLVAIFLGGLEQTIVAVALPLMSADLSGVEYLAWVISGYLIAMTVATPIYGKLGDLYGRRLMLFSAIVIFLLSSVLCALATTMPVMILARVIQGIGGAGLLSVSQTIVGDIIAPRDRGRYQGYISTAFAIASVTGPVVGGLLTEYISWRWIFWINVPLCIVAYLTAHRALNNLPIPQLKRQIDYLGALWLTAGLTVLLIAISRVGHGAALAETLNVFLYVLAVVLLAIFVWQEKRAPDPIIPLMLLRNRTVAASSLMLFVAFVQMIGMTILIPLRLQMLTHAGADEAAVQLLPLSLSIPVGAWIAGLLMVKLGHYRRIQLAGTALLPIALALTAYTPANGTLLVILCTSLGGFGIGLLLPTSTVAAQNAVEHRHLGVATGVTSFARSLGAALGIAVLTAVLFALLNQYTPAGLSLSVSATDVIGEMVEGALQQAASEERQALVEAGTLAFRHVFLLSAAIALVGVLACLFAPDRRLSDKKPEVESH
ncbi:MAG: MFS transporter [Pusillimonas sp.]|nr:MFS transporter [Pusillimonas sp.]